MNILMVIIGGIILLGVFCLFGRLWGADMTALVPAAKAFIPVWFMIAAVNMYIGVMRAGSQTIDAAPPRSNSQSSSRPFSRSHMAHPKSPTQSPSNAN